MYQKTGNSNVEDVPAEAGTESRGKKHICLHSRRGFITEYMNKAPVKQKFFSALHLNGFKYMFV